MEFGLFWVAMAPFGLKTGASGPKSRSGPVFQNPGPDLGPILRQNIFVWTCSGYCCVWAYAAGGDCWSTPEAEKAGQESAKGHARGQQ